MDNKEFKRYKKELRGHGPLKKIGNALTASGHVIGRKIETDEAVAKNRTKRNIEKLKEMASKMKS